MSEIQLTSEEKNNVLTLVYDLTNFRTNLISFDKKVQKEHEKKLKNDLIIKSGWTLESFHEFIHTPEYDEIVREDNEKQLLEQREYTLKRWRSASPEIKLDAIQWYMKDAKVPMKNVRGAKASDYITFIANKLRSDNIVLPPKDIKDMAEYFMTYGNSQPSGV